MTPAVLLQILLTVIGSGAIFTFLQFLITRHDTKQEKAKNNEIDSLRVELKDHLTNTNANWKETYCDRNFQMIDNLSKEMREGLADREERGLARYKEHEETINELKEAVLQLVQNDTEMKEYMKAIGESLTGLSHDKILYLSNKYTKRGAITLREKATLKSIYEPYKKLGGNGDCEVAFNYISKLPIVSEDKAKELDVSIRD